MQQNNKIIDHPAALLREKLEFQRLGKLLKPETQQDLNIIFNLSPNMSIKEGIKLINENLEKDIINAGKEYDKYLRETTPHRLVWYVGGRIRETLVTNKTSKSCYIFKHRAVASKRYKIGALIVEKI